MKRLIIVLLFILSCGSVSYGAVIGDSVIYGPTAASITSGTIDGAMIGATTPATGKFTAITTTGSVGINSSPTTTPLTVTGTSATYGPTYGSELLTSAGWTVTTGWAESPDDTFTHTAGSTNALTHSATIASGTRYQISWTVANRTAGSVTIAVGAQSNANLTATGSWGPTTTSTDGFTITPTSDFNGVISNVSVKAITRLSTAHIELKNSAGTSAGEIRMNPTTYLTAIGMYSAGLNTTGSENSFLGSYSGYSNTTGSYNSFLGRYAGYANTTGNNNSFLGSSSGHANTTGSYNSFLGSSSGYANTTGNENSFLGSYSGYSNTTGSYNSFLGRSSGYANTTGNNNSFLGSSSGHSNTTGSYNSFLGSGAGRYQADGTTALTTSNYSVYIGYGARGYSNSDSNSVVIAGTTGIGAGANTTVIGNTSTTATYLKGTLNVSSGGSAGKAVCWKANGTTLGYCSSAVAADGSCTCN